MSYERNKPYPEAVATERGWVDHVTGELLVAIRGLASKIAQFEKSSDATEEVQTVVVEVPPAVQTQVIEPVVETPVEPVPVEVPVEQVPAVEVSVEPKKRGRKPKNSQ